MNDSSGRAADSSSSGVSGKYSYIASGCYDCRNAGDKTWVCGSGIETGEANGRHHRGRVGDVWNVIGLIVVVILVAPGQCGVQHGSWQLRPASLPRVPNIPETRGSLEDGGDRGKSRCD